MEKLSSILPTNNRIATVDTQAARAVRPGANGFGAPIATHEPRPNLSGSTLLNISSAAHDMKHDADKGRAVSKELEGQYFANRRADIENRVHDRAEAQEIEHSFAPDEKMHIADALANGPTTHAGAPVMGPAAAGNTGNAILPHAVERMQASPHERGGRLSILA